MRALWYITTRLVQGLFNEHAIVELDRFGCETECQAFVGWDQIKKPFVRLIFQLICATEIGQGIYEL